MDAFTTRLSNTLRERIEAKGHDLTNGLASVIVADFSDYKFCVGQVRGLKLALQILSEIEKELGRAEDVERAAVGHRRYEE